MPQGVLKIEIVHQVLKSFARACNNKVVSISYFLKSRTDIITVPWDGNRWFSPGASAVGGKVLRRSSAMLSSKSEK